MAVSFRYFSLRSQHTNQKLTVEYFRLFPPDFSRAPLNVLILAYQKFLKMAISNCKSFFSKILPLTKLSTRVRIVVKTVRRRLCL